MKQQSISKSNHGQVKQLLASAAGIQLAQRAQQNESPAASARAAVNCQSQSAAAKCNTHDPVAACHQIT
jgi:hypothetical protein